jgi:hypothetical protein
MILPCEPSLKESLPTRPRQTIARGFLGGLIIFLAIMVLGLTPVRANMVIVPVWDSSITTNAAYSMITNTIMQAIAVYEGCFSNNITIYINFQSDTNVALGESDYSYYFVSYPYYRSHLVAGASTLYDTNALAHLPNTTTNPVNGNVTNYVNLPLGRALGMTQDGFGHSINWSTSASNPDGTVYLNTSIMNLSRPPTNPDNYDLQAVASHEIDEVLGIGSALSGLNNGDPAPTGAIPPYDMFRYDQNGHRSFNTATNTLAYFSLDGVTKWVQFNQYEYGDFNDWNSWPYGAATPRVQDAFSTAGATPNLDVELIALDVIGYNLVVPKLTLTKTGAHTATISWPASTAGFILQVSTNLASTNWLDSVTGTNDPVTVTNSAPAKFYRLGRN